MSPSSSPAAAQAVAALQTQCDESPYIRFAGIRVVDIDADAQAVRFAMAFKPEFERGEGTGQFHGGPIASLIDTAGCMALCSTPALHPRPLKTPRAKPASARRAITSWPSTPSIPTTPITRWQPGPLTRRPRQMNLCWPGAPRRITA